MLSDLDAETSCDTRQLDILIKLDFFSEFGNQRELLRITDLFYQTFKRGQAKQIKKSIVDGTPLEPIISKYAVGVTKSGGVAKSYTLLDVKSILQESEDALKSVGMTDLSDIDKVRNFYDVMGYIGYISGKTEDRPKAGTASAVLVFPMTGGEFLSQQHALFPCTLAKHKSEKAQEHGKEEDTILSALTTEEQKQLQTLLTKLQAQWLKDHAAHHKRP